MTGRFFFLFFSSIEKGVAAGNVTSFNISAIEWLFMNISRLRSPFKLCRWIGNYSTLAGRPRPANAIFDPISYSRLMICNELNMDQQSGYCFHVSYVHIEWRSRLFCTSFFVSKMFSPSVSPFLFVEINRLTIDRFEYRIVWPIPIDHLRLQCKERKAGHQECPARSSAGKRKDFNGEL